MPASGVAVEGGDISSVANEFPHPFGLAQEERRRCACFCANSDPVCHPLCPTIPEGCPHPGFSHFPRLPWAGSAWGPCRQGPGSLASCQRGCQPARSFASPLPGRGGRGGVALLLDLLVTPGSPWPSTLRSGAFLGEQVPGFPHPAPAALPALPLSGIDLAGTRAACWARAAGTERETPSPEPGLHCTPGGGLFLVSCLSLLPAGCTLGPGSSPAREPRRLPTSITFFFCFFYS